MFLKRIAHVAAQAGVDTAVAEHRLAARGLGTGITPPRAGALIPAPVRAAP